mmetsp:Transcript_18608/g.38040  ORF Transcript_18608/g.38040 Transcript_18608/m.38040 type:complete len:351 (-) Transcript_18608:31-1083(-)
MAQPTLLVYYTLALNVTLTFTSAFQHISWMSNRFIEIRNCDGVISHKIARMNHRDKDYSIEMSLCSSCISDQMKWGNPPYLALLTEPDACSSFKRMEETLHAIETATFDGGVNLVVVRVPEDGGDDILRERKMTLLQKLAELKEERLIDQQGIQNDDRKGFFYVVINNDLDLAIEAISQNVSLDGIHVKERNASEIPMIRKILHDAAETSKSTNNRSTESMKINYFIIGTSCHSIQSAIKFYTLQPQGPDYLFVGTCYLTQSHPEKTSIDQLEGPTLPGKVKKELETLKSSSLESIHPSVPKIFAIGGIDEINCFEPVVKHGADGVATIRAVMQAEDPRAVVRSMIRLMQ